MNHRPSSTLRLLVLALSVAGCAFKPLKASSDGEVMTVDGGNVLDSAAGDSSPSADSSDDTPQLFDAGLDTPRGDTGSPVDLPTSAEAGAAGGANGVACNSGLECVSGNCVDGLCCESLCAGQCEACGERGHEGRCVAVSGPPRGRVACAGAQTPCAGKCDGSNRTACSYPGATTECVPASCKDGVAVTRSVCDGRGACPVPVMATCAPFTCSGTICSGGCSTSQPCVGETYCDGGRCYPKKGPGAACTDPGQCGGGRCVDGVCCDAICNGGCQACNLANNVGHCGVVRSSDDDTCQGGVTCDAGGACRKRPGSDCVAGSECATGSCIDGKCCLLGACGTCQACTGGGGTCIAVVAAPDPDSCAGSGKMCDLNGACVTKRALGIGCTDGGQCSSGICSDGVCCDRACNGQCESCNRSGAPGTCGYVSGTPVGGRGACSGSGECASTCDGSGPACRYSTGACGTATCSGTTYTPRGTCNGAGICTAGNGRSCGNYVCNSGGCLTSCGSGADCAPGLTCSGAGGTCDVPSTGTWTLTSTSYQTTGSNATSAPSGACSPKGSTKVVLMAQMPMGSQVGFVHNATFDSIHCGPGQWNYDSAKCRECGGSLTVDSCMMGWSICKPANSQATFWYPDTQPGGTENGCRTDLTVIAQNYTCQ
jgi:hypothetical protein